MQSVTNYDDSQDQGSVYVNSHGGTLNDFLQGTWKKQQQ